MACSSPSAKASNAEGERRQSSGMSSAHRARDRINKFDAQCCSTRGIFPHCQRRPSSVRALPTNSATSHQEPSRDLCRINIFCTPATWDALGKLIKPVDHFLRGKACRRRRDFGLFGRYFLQNMKGWKLSLPKSLQIFHRETAVVTMGSNAGKPTVIRPSFDAGYTNLQKRRRLTSCHQIRQSSRLSSPSASLSATLSTTHLPALLGTSDCCPLLFTLFQISQPLCISCVVFPKPQRRPRKHWPHEKIQSA